MKTKYLIIGGGMTANAAVRGIRDIDSEGSITLVSSEADPPYKRPPLSKDLWKGVSIDKIWSGTAKRGVDLHLGRTITTLDVAAKSATDDQGNVYEYEKALLATGSRPRQLPIDLDQIIYFRTVADFRQLQQLADSKESFAVIGGGFIGSEIAAALAMNGKKVSLIFPEVGISSRLFPSDLSTSLNDVYREHGVEVLADTRVTNGKRIGETATLELVSNGQTQTLTVDGVIAGIGAQPNVELATAANIDIDNGIVVDEFLRTNQPDVFAAGDVASYWQPALGLRRRVEHEDNANVMGRHAGRAMAGDLQPYHHLPFFYSDLFELGYEAVGVLDPRLDVVTEWVKPYREGVITYGRDNRLCGVLLWNVWGQVDNARTLITEGAPLAPNAFLQSETQTV